MPIYPIDNTKMVIVNEEKTRGLVVEYPKNMGNGEVLDRINEFRTALLNSIEKEAKDAEKAKEEFVPVVEEVKP